MNNSHLTRKQKLKNAINSKKSKLPKVKIDNEAYAKAYVAYNEFFNSISSEFRLADGTIVREVL